MKAAGEFTQELWDNTSKIYNEIINCEFVVGLANGTLAEDSFKHYLSQDVLYIQQDTKALAQMSQRAVLKEEKDFFLKMSVDCMEIENILHDEFLDHFQVQEAKSQSYAFANYSNYLLHQTHNAEYPVAVAALLPCFWLYGKVGHHIIDNQSPDNKYQKFIDTYAGDEYVNYTRQFISILETNAQNIDCSTRQDIVDAFIKSSRYELEVFKESTDN